MSLSQSIPKQRFDEISYLKKPHYINKNYLKKQSFNQSQFMSLEQTFHKRNQKTMLQKSIEYNIKLLDNKDEIGKNLIFNPRHLPDIKYQTSENLGYLKNTSITCLIHNKNKYYLQNSIDLRDIKLKFENQQIQYLKKIEELNFLKNNIKVKAIQKKDSNENSPRQVQKSDDKKQQKQETIIYSFLLPNPDSDIIGIINTNPLKPTTFVNSNLVCLQNKVYLYGGRSCVVNKYLYELNLQQFQWTRNRISKQIPISYYGNQTLTYGTNLFYVFGGETPENNTRLEQFQEMIDNDKPIIVRDVCNNLNCYDAKENQWNQVMAQYPPKERRNHGSCIIANKFLMIYGGIDKKGRQKINILNFYIGKYLSDVNILNFETLVWEKIEIEGDLDGQNGLAFHCMLYIQKTDYKIQSLINPLPDIKKEQPFQKGIFSFGGKKACGNSSGRLKVCRIGQNPLQWSTIKGQGKPPLRRNQHTMNYIEQIMSIVIHGGYSEQIGSALNDIHLFNLQHLEWQEVNKLGNKLLPRIGHSAQTTLFIFGGLDSSQHQNSEVQIIELDQDRAIMRSQNQILDSHSIYIYKKTGEAQNQTRVQSKQSSRRQSAKRQSQKNTSIQPEEHQDEYDNFISFKPIPTKLMLKTQKENVLI